MCVRVCVLCHIIMEHLNTLQCKYVCVRVCALPRCHGALKHIAVPICVCACVCALPHYHGALKHIAVPVCVCACVCFATLSWSTETHCSASMCVCVCVLCHVVMEHLNTLQCQQWHESMLCVCSITCVTEHQDVASWYACCEHARVCVFVSGK